MIIKVVKFKPKDLNIFASHITNKQLIKTKKYYLALGQILERKKLCLYVVGIHKHYNV